MPGGGEVLQPSSGRWLRQLHGCGRGGAMTSSIVGETVASRRVVSSCRLCPADNDMKLYVYRTSPCLDGVPLASK